MSVQEIDTTVREMLIPNYAPDIFEKLILSHSDRSTLRNHGIFTNEHILGHAWHCIYKLLSFACIDLANVVSEHILGSLELPTHGISAIPPCSDINDFRARYIGNFRSVMGSHLSVCCKMFPELSVPKLDVDNSRNYVLNFGPYAGQTIASIMRQDDGYIRWCADTMSTPVQTHCLVSLGYVPTITSGESVPICQGREILTTAFETLINIVRLQSAKIAELELQLLKMRSITIRKCSYRSYPRHAHLDIVNICENLGTVVFIDTETTGLTSSDRIIEIAAIRRNYSTMTDTRFELLINPCGHPINRHAQAVHKITADDLKHSPTFAKIAELFVEFIGDHQLIAHNAQFDRDKINHELSLCGKDPLPIDRFVCTLGMSRQVIPGRNRLADVVAHFGIPITHSSQHRAMYDTELLADIYPPLVIESAA